MRDAAHRSAAAAANSLHVEPQQPRLGERRGTFLLLLFPFKIKKNNNNNNLPVFTVSQNLGASDDAGSIKAVLSRSLFSSEEEVSHAAPLARSVWFRATPGRVSVKKAPSFPGVPFAGIIICLNIRGAPAALHFVFPLSGFPWPRHVRLRVFCKPR